MQCSVVKSTIHFSRRLSVRMDRVDKPDGPPKLPEGLKSLGMGLGANGAPLQDVSSKFQPRLNLTFYVNV